MKKLRTQLSLGFALIAMVTIFLVSLVANVCISRQFAQYVAQQQQSASDDLAAGLALAYDDASEGWNLDYVHGFGMHALGDGYIIKLCDAQGNVVWDAENHDMTLCHQVMEDIRQRMAQRQPALAGDFQTHQYPLIRDGAAIGRLDIRYYGPYAFNEDAFRFLDALNVILVAVGALSLLGAGLAGMRLARSIAAPIVKTTQITREIAGGNYQIRFAAQSRTRELSELTCAVNQMAEALESQEEMRRRLTTDVAHELRTPLANVAAQLEAILEGVWEPTRERLARCQEEIARLTHLVGDLERLRAMERDAAAPPRQMVELLALCRREAAHFEAEMAAKGLHCAVEGSPATVPGDPARLAQVVSNLMSNAVKYTGEGGHITLRVADTPTHAILTVEDDGIGIPEADRARVFERFYRTDRSRSRKTGGVGIGLTIVRAIVRAHGGEVVAEGRPGPGTRMVVHLPKA